VTVVDSQQTGLRSNVPDAGCSSLVTLHSSVLLMFWRESHGKADVAGTKGPGGLGRL
jgi:hypothetical protein